MTGGGGALSIVQGPASARAATLQSAPPHALGHACAWTEGDLPDDIRALLAQLEGMPQDAALCVADAVFLGGMQPSQQSADTDIAALDARAIWFADDLSPDLLAALDALAARENWPKVSAPGGRAWVIWLRDHGMGLSALIMSVAPVLAAEPQHEPIEAPERATRPVPAPASAQGAAPGGAEALALGAALAAFVPVRRHGSLAGKRYRKAARVEHDG